MSKPDPKPLPEKERLANLIADYAAAGGDVAQLLAGTKNAAAVALGKRGGLKGGPARAERLSAEQRREIALKAANARWKTRKDESHER